MASRGLLARLSAPDGRAASAALDVGQAVAAHLRVLLNTRQGDSVSAPELGIVDFSDVVHNFPHAITVLQHSIRNTLLKFEPRLKNVTVRHLPSEDPLELRFEIAAQLVAHNEALRFQTQVKPGGQVEVW